MNKSFEDIFKQEASWVYEISKLGRLNKTINFLDRHKYEVTVAIHQAIEKYFKFLLFKKYGLDDLKEVPNYINGITKYKFNELRFGHDLDSLYNEVSELMPEHQKNMYISVNSILSNCYLDLRYPNLNNKQSIQDKIDEDFLKMELSFVNKVYNDNGGVAVSKPFIVGIKEAANKVKEIDELNEIIKEQNRIIRELKDKVEGSEDLMELFS